MDIFFENVHIFEQLFTSMFVPYLVSLLTAILPEQWELAGAILFVFLGLFLSQGHGTPTYTLHSSRTVSPTSIFTSNFTLLYSYPHMGKFSSNGSLLVYDFGKEVGGIVTISYAATGSGELGLAFSEARNWTGSASNGSNGRYIHGADGALFTNITNTTKGSCTMPDMNMRGRFRYLSLFTFTNNTISVQVTDVTLEISFQPTCSDLRAYSGYFYSSDDLLNRIWYARAYTLQTNAIPPYAGRVYPLLETGWRNDSCLGTNGSSILVDGCKRGRATWAGDLGTALPSVLLALETSKAPKMHYSCSMIFKYV